MPPKSKYKSKVKYDFATPAYRASEFSDDRGKKGGPRPDFSSISALNERICNAFERINQEELKEREIQKELHWLLEDINQHIEFVDAVSVSLLFNKLKHSSLATQFIASQNGLIALLVKISNDLLSHTTSSRQFKSRELTRALEALSMLPYKDKELDKLMSRLIEKGKELQISESFIYKDSTVILLSLAQLEINLSKYMSLIKDFLKTFIPYKKCIEEQFDFFMLSNLWKFCVFAKAKIHDEEIERIFLIVNSALEKCENPLVSAPSTYQSKVSSLILNLLSTEAAKQIRQEYVVGPYTLDMFWPEQNLNIEIDGPHHYYKQQLSKADTFRDAILAYKGIRVIRIPYFEWELEPTEADKEHYLSEKLLDYLLEEKAVGDSSASECSNIPIKRCQI